MVSVICLRYGYHTEYVASKSFEWRHHRLNDITRDLATDKLWQLKLISMSHSPGTEQGATKLQEQFRADQKELISAIRKANNEPEPEDRDELDGIMRFIDD